MFCVAGGDGPPPTSASVSTTSAPERSPPRGAGSVTSRGRAASRSGGDGTSADAPRNQLMPDRSTGLRQYETSARARPVRLGRSPPIGRFAGGRVIERRNSVHVKKLLVAGAIGLAVLALAVQPASAVNP